MGAEYGYSLHHLHGLHLHPEQMLVVGWDELGQTGDVSGDVCCRRLQDGRVPLPGAGVAAHRVETLPVIVDDVMRRNGQPGQSSQSRRAQAGLQADLVEPGVGDDGGEAGPAVGLHPEALPDQVLTLGGHSVAEPHLRHTDLLVRLEGDVAADHVEEEDAQGPDGGQLSVVSVVSDPLWRGVHPGPVEVGVGAVPQLSPGPEVNQLQLQSFQVNEEIFVLDVSVNDSVPVAGEDSFNNLAEEVSR